VLFPSIYSTGLSTAKILGCIRDKRAFEAKIGVSWALHYLDEENRTKEQAKKSLIF